MSLNERIFKNYVKQINFLFESFSVVKQKFSEEAPKEEVVDYLNRFNELRSLNILKSADIDVSQFISKGFENFKNFVEKKEKEKQYYLSKKQQKDHIKVNSNKIHTVEKTKDYHLFIPLSREASCFYGYGQSWCISTKSINNAFYYYKLNSNTIIFFLINNKEDASEKKNIYAYIVDPTAQRGEEIIERQDWRNENSVPKSKFREITGKSESFLVQVARKFNKQDEIIKNKKKSDEYDFKHVFTKLKKGIKTEDEKHMVTFYYKDNKNEKERSILESMMLEYDFVEFADTIVKDKGNTPEKITELYHKYDTMKKYVDNMITRSLDLYLDRPLDKYVEVENIIRRMANGRKVPELEKHIVDDPRLSVPYAEHSLSRTRWPEAEKYFLRGAITGNTGSEIDRAISLLDYALKVLGMPYSVYAEKHFEDDKKRKKLFHDVEEKILASQYSDAYKYNFPKYYKNNNRQKT